MNFRAEDIHCLQELHAPEPASQEAEELRVQLAMRHSA